MSLESIRLQPDHNLIGMETARDIMGWETTSDRIIPPADYFADYEGSVHWEPSTKVGQALLVLLKLNFRFIIDPTPEDGFQVTVFYGHWPRSVVAYGDTLPHAMCLAAIAARKRANDRRTT